MTKNVHKNMKQIGTITHYYDKIGVAIVELKGELKVGDKVLIGKEDDGIEQEIDSMQIDHEEVRKAKKGDVVGIKVGKRVRGNSPVHLLD